MKKINAMMIGAVLMGFSHGANAQGFMHHDFDDNSMGPFVDCTTKSPNYAKPVNGRLKTYWIESSYDGSRMTKGAEACGNTVANGVGYLTVKHCWLGFTMNIAENYIQNNDTQAGLMQIFGFDPRYGMSSWTAMFDFSHGDLTWVDRTDQGMAKTYGTIMENVPKGQDLNVIVHVELSKNNEGTVEIFIDGDLKYSRYNTNIGMGDFNNNDEQDWTSVTEFKIGQYNYENPKYTPGEERIVYYDNITWYDEANGYFIVDPSQGADSGSSFEPDPSKTYYIDSPVHNLRLAATGSSEDAYTTSTSTTGADVEWQFVAKGNGYWHIQRAAGGTKPRLRTDSTANADMQETSSSGSFTYYDFSTGSSSGTHFLTLPNGPSSYSRLQVNNDGAVNMVTPSYSGTWESFKITEASDGIVLFRKRNASGYGLDGGNGGANGQNVYLWSYSANNVNQQWEETDRGDGFYSYTKKGTDFSLDGGNGGANGQNVYLWTTSNNNYNQHWKKVDVGGGYIQLQKRNSTGFAIDGGNGGANGQNLYLWDYGSSNQNQHWQVEYK